MGATAAFSVAGEGPLRLDEITREALERNPEILAAQKRYEAARQRPAQASSLPDPMLSVGYNSTGNPLPGAGIGTDPVANAGFSITQPLPWPGKRKLRGDIAEREADAGLEEYRGVELSVVSRAKQAYYRLRNAYVSVEILCRNRDLLQKFLRITEARYSVGKAAQQDVFKAQAQLSIIETRMERLRQEISSRKAEINSLLNRAPDAAMGEPVEVSPQPLTASLDQLLAQVRTNAPEIRRDQKLVERTQLAVNLARKDYYPDYAVTGGYYSMGSMGPMYVARVDVTLPVYYWRKQRAALAEQTATASEARHNYATANQMLSFRVKDDYLLAQTSYRLMKMYSTTVVPQSSLALESSLASYETGSVDSLSVLSNFTTVLEYELNYRDELLNYLLALARLEEMGLKL